MIYYDHQTLGFLNLFSPSAYDSSDDERFQNYKAFFTILDTRGHEIPLTIAYLYKNEIIRLANLIY